MKDEYDYFNEGTKGPVIKQPSVFDNNFDLYYTRVVKRKDRKQEIDITKLLTVVSQLGSSQVVINLRD